MSVQDKYETVIGLEVHAQLLTETKMFCSCRNHFGSEPNTLICPVCTGQPGSLPVVNRRAIELGVRAALALNCQINERSVFARKNYFYPDLPKGYQISQYEAPFSQHGHLFVTLKSGDVRKIGVTRAHFEEDAGKSSHVGTGSLVNLNRAGVPLVEIVSEPDMRNSHEAGQYLRTVRSLLRYAEVCDGNMEEGSFRCDANISVRLKGAKEFGTKVELKNINSFRYVERAIDFEIERQIQLIEKGEKITQQTRSWDPAKNVTELMREKENAHDYRYFPDPDLAVLVIDEPWRKSIESSMPELPRAIRERFKETFGLSDYDAGVLTAEKELAKFYESVVKGSANAKMSANWVMNELLGKLNANGQSIEQSPISADDLGALVAKVVSNEISGKMAKMVFEEMFDSGKSAASIIQQKGLSQISDTDSLEPIVKAVVQKNPTQVADYLGGKDKLLGFFVGQVMKETKGQANPATLNEIVKKVLEGERK